jgi:hypothetical protein
MWRLKIAESGKDPYIFSTNNFVGRQIWEFDPRAGTPEERAEVEEARQHFYNNRFHVKPSSDLLWRMQVFPSSLSDLYQHHLILYTKNAYFPVPAMVTCNLSHCINVCVMV